MKRSPTVLLSIVAVIFVLLVAGVVRAQQPPPVTTVQANRAPHPAPGQPLPFSHKSHVGRGVRCQACHPNPEPGTQMTLPTTATCMGCHGSVATGHPAILKLAELAKSNQPVPWVRVYELMPGVTWAHRKHLQSGIQCEMCHGAVGEMDAMAETTAVTGMASCISCHSANKASTACTTCHAWPAG